MDAEKNKMTDNTNIQKSNRLKMTIIPPAPCSDKILLDIRAAMLNGENRPKEMTVSVYLDAEQDEKLLYSSQCSVDSGQWLDVRFEWPTKQAIGKHKIITKVRYEDKTYTAAEQIEIIASETRALKRIHGSWASLVHWSDIEAKYWQEDIKKLNDEQWRDIVRGMAELGFNIVVIQEVVRNQMYVGSHNIEKNGYHGKAFYPSELYPGRMDMAAEDPIETILDEADKTGIKVFPGVGLYAWFDFTPGSLKWHKKTAVELWNRYGHHKSFYGWYVSEECEGNLGFDEVHRKLIVDFFAEFKRFVRKFSPDKPVMLAPNCHKIRQSQNYWPKLLKNLDIVCPFGFHRMPKGDTSGKEAAETLQRLCDEAHSHLWLDMEVFLFEDDFGTPLYPRPIEGAVSDMQKFQNFEKIICYQYPGLMNAPWAQVKPGGERTVKLFCDYKKYTQENPA